MTHSRRQILTKSLAAAAGGMLTLALPGCGDDMSSHDLAAGAREAFREGNYGVIRNVYVSPDEMRLIEEKLAQDPDALPDGEAVLDFLIPTSG